MAIHDPSDSRVLGTPEGPGGRFYYIREADAEVVCMALELCLSYGHGGIAHPWPDGEDEGGLRRVVAALREGTD